jgi:formyltetrahydrofolate-dependent phosphoribosylglycinamide formyltransferase
MRHTKLAVLLSGGGTTLENFFRKIAAGELDAEVVVVGSSREDAYGLVRAKDHGVRTFIVQSRRYKGQTEAFSAAIFEELGKYEFDLLLLAGFMCLLRIPDELDGRVMNIHPALIPAFCGEGLYGHLVHEAVLEYGTRLSGCTVHFADNVYDHGPIIVQKTVAVLDGDTAETLAARVFTKECEAYPEAVRLYGEGRLRIKGRRVRILDKPDGAP